MNPDSEPFVRDLNPDEMDKLIQFQDITGIDDIEVCRALLESKEWDLESAAREQLNLPGVNAVPVREDQYYSQPLDESIESLTNMPLTSSSTEAVGYTSWLSWGLYMVTLPITYPLRLACQALFYCIGMIDSIVGISRAFQDHPSINYPQNIESSLEDVNNFVADFEAKYGSNHAPFTLLTYAQALNISKRNLNFMLVYLHNPSHRDTPRFCTDILSSSSFISFVVNNNIVFWACSTVSVEGYRVSQALRLSKYPFLALIVLRNNRMTVVGRIEGFLTSVSDLTARLMSIIRDNEAFVVAARTERLELNRTQEIRNEQDEDFRFSLLQDQEKERKRLLEVENQRRIEAEEEEKAKQTRLRIDIIKQLKLDLAYLIPEEPDTSNAECVRILIKLSNGQRLERRFLRSQSLSALFYYVFCHPDSPDRFSITTNFPRQVLNCIPSSFMKYLEAAQIEGNGNISVNNYISSQQDETNTFEEVGLVQSTMLFVDDLDA